MNDHDILIAPMHPCNDTKGMEWVKLREGLANCRKAARLSQASLAQKMRVAKSTVNRIENVYGEPDYKPDLETIELYLRECGGSLHHFFAALENSAEMRTSSVTVLSHNAGSSLPGVVDGPSQPAQGRAVPPVSESDALLIERLCLSILGAISSALPDRPLPNPHVDESERRKDVADLG